MMILADVDGFDQLWIITRLWSARLLLWMFFVLVDHCLLDAAETLTWFKCAACVLKSPRRTDARDCVQTDVNFRWLWTERHLNAFWQHNFCVCVLSDWKVSVGSFSASDTWTHEDRCPCILLMSRWACAWEKTRCYLAHRFRTKPGSTCQPCMYSCVSVFFSRRSHRTRKWQRGTQHIQYIFFLISGICLTVILKIIVMIECWFKWLFLSRTYCCGRNGTPY